MILRHSHKRDAILQALCSTTSHPNAQWVYEELRHLFPDLSLGTVYRNIAQLQASGQLQQVAVVDGEQRFDAVAMDHPHFICERCNQVFDPPHDPEKECAPAFIAEEGHRIHYGKSVFYGVCRDCGGNAPLK